MVRLTVSIYIQSMHTLTRSSLVFLSGLLSLEDKSSDRWEGPAASAVCIYIMRYWRRPMHSARELCRGASTELIPLIAGTLSRMSYRLLQGISLRAGRASSTKSFRCRRSLTLPLLTRTAPRHLWGRRSAPRLVNIWGETTHLHQ